MLQLDVSNEIFDNHDTSEKSFLLSIYFRSLASFMCMYSFNLLLIWINQYCKL